MQPQQQILVLAVVAILALTVFLCGQDYGLHRFLETTAETEEHRVLRFSQFQDPTSSMVTANLNTTLNIYLSGDRDNPAYSIFHTDIIQRYASGRFQYKIHYHTPCDASCSVDVVDTATPCLAVTKKPDKWGGCPHQHLACTYPKCKTMVTNDERCNQGMYDVREYYSARFPNKGYLPLGPRMDAWTSFQKAQAHPDFGFKHSSQRKYAFNAIFSRSTNYQRSQLAGIIDKNREKTSLEIFTHMANQWTPNVNDPKSAQLDTDAYINVALDSVFTLSPAGHNPECFRLFEAVEAGSIPVVTRQDLYGANAMCQEALHHWKDAPIVILTSWYNLFIEIEALMANGGEKLDKMQVELRMWYDDYMKGVVGDFEDYMIDSHVEDSVKEEAIVA